MTPDEPRIGPHRLYRIAWTVYLILAIAGAVWMGIARGGLALYQLASPDRWPLELAAGVGTGLALVGLWELGRHTLPLARELERVLSDVLTGLPAADALALALISAFAEELFFRGAVQGSLGIAVATVLFALLHTGPGRAFWLWSFFAAVAGLAFGLLVRELGTLLAPMTAHFVVNAVNLTRIARSRPDRPDRPERPERPEPPAEGPPAGGTA